jgi:hypothetical protein
MQGARCQSGAKFQNASLPMTAGGGPKCQFAAVQRYGRCRWNTGRSVDVADTAAPDPKRSLLASVRTHR